MSRTSGGPHGFGGIPTPPGIGTGLSGIVNPQAGVADIYLGVGVELLLAGAAALIANISDDAGNIMLVFVVGLLVLWLMRHTFITGAIPGIFNYLRQKGAVG